MVTLKMKVNEEQGKEWGSELHLARMRGEDRDKTEMKKGGKGQLGK